MEQPYNHGHGGGKGKAPGDRFEEIDNDYKPNEMVYGLSGMKGASSDLSKIKSQMPAYPTDE